MIDVPAPFVVALLLAIVAISHRDALHGSAGGRVFAAVLWLNVLSLVLVGLRWRFDLVQLLPFLAVASIVATALLFLGFRSLGEDAPSWRAARDWPHALPVLLVSSVVTLSPLHTDWALAPAKLVYAVALASLARRSDEAFQLVRIARLVDVRRALWGAAALTAASAALDVAIAIDFARHGGRHAPVLVGVVSLALLPLLGWLAVRAADARAQEATPDSIPDGAARTTGAEPSPTRSASGASGASSSSGRNSAIAADGSDASDAAQSPSSTMRALDRLLRETRLFADPELNLRRLARKAGLAPRIVSRTVNEETGTNVSRWVNRARIDEACRLLAGGEVPITRAMQEAGFLTKSNFHREFRRIHGCSPSEWRERRESLGPDGADAATPQSGGSASGTPRG